MPLKETLHAIAIISRKLGILIRTKSLVDFGK
jgi:hypothetical protein